MISSLRPTTDARWPIVAVVLTLSVGSTALAQSELKKSENDSASGEKPQEITYRGELQDQQGNPISGVFHLEFNLYPTETSSNSIWSKRHYVSVTDGSYRVPLGSKQTLPKKSLDQSSYIGITLVGSGEILRDRLRIDTDSPDQASGDDRQKVSEQTKKLMKKARTSTDLAYADVAERALQADHADTADKLGDLTADEVEKLATSDEKALERLGEHIANPNAHNNSIGGGVGESKRVMRSVGGSGGANFSVDCPDGYVMTGIRGGAGNMIDRISIVCSPLN